MSRRNPQEELRLVDKNIRDSSPLVGWWCDRCKRPLYYPANKPTPQCPHCSAEGFMVRMKRYF